MFYPKVAIMENSDLDELAKNGDAIEKLVTSSLMCCICGEVSLDSLQCFNGHAHCTECIDGMRNANHLYRRILPCSVCRSRRSWGSMRLVVDIAKTANVMFSCGIDGCDHRDRIDKIEEHRAACKYKTFDCPLQCDCQPMQMCRLLQHIESHRSIKNITPQECLNIFALASDSTNAHYLVMNGNIICIQLSFRMCNLDLIGVEIRAGVIGNRGHVPGIRMNVQIYDLCSTNMSKTSAELVCTENIDGIINHGVMCCYDNFISDTCESFCVIEEQWSRAKFVNKYRNHISSHEEYENARVAAIIVHFEHIDPREYCDFTTPFAIPL